MKHKTNAAICLLWAIGFFANAYNGRTSITRQNEKEHGVRFKVEFQENQGLLQIFITAPAAVKTLPQSGFEITQLDPDGKATLRVPIAPTIWIVSPDGGKLTIDGPDPKVVFSVSKEKLAETKLLVRYGGYGFESGWSYIVDLSSYRLVNTSLNSNEQKLTEEERGVLQNYYTSIKMVERAARICLNRRLTRASVLKNVSNTMRSKVTDNSINYFFAPSQIWTLTFDENDRVLAANITGREITRDDGESKPMADPAPPVFADPSPTAPPQVAINSQETLIGIFGGGFGDKTWAYPADLLPTEYPGFEYVSGPLDKSVSPKGAWRKPVVLKHKATSTTLHLNCYRQHDKVPGPKTGSPSVPLKEPDYQYKKLAFHNLTSANAAWDNLHLILFQHGDVLYKVEAIGGKIDSRKQLAMDIAETIWKNQRAASDSNAAKPASVTDLAKRFSDRYGPIGKIPRSDWNPTARNRDKIVEAVKAMERETPSIGKTKDWRWDEAELYIDGKGNHLLWIYYQSRNRVKVWRWYQVDGESKQIMSGGWGEG